MRNLKNAPASLDVPSKQERQTQFRAKSAQLEPAEAVEKAMLVPKQLVAKFKPKAWPR